MNIKNAISPLSRFFSQKRLIKWTGREIIFPFYHTISDDDLPYISNLYPLRSINDFKKGLDYFCKHFNPVNLEEVFDRVHSPKKFGKPAFHLSFDDGLREVHQIIAPILEERGIPATFFINTDFIDNQSLFYRYKIGLILEYLKNNNDNDLNKQVQTILADNSLWNGELKNSLLQLNYHNQKLIDNIAQIVAIDFDDWLSKHDPYLSTAQITDLLKRGFTMGSHSADHPRFKNINLEQQKIQVKKSFDVLKKKFGVDERIFSFPFGDEGVNATLFDWMYGEAGCKLSFGVSGIKDDYSPFHIHRIPMDDCIGSPQQFIKSEYLYYMLKSVFNKNQIKRN